MENKQKNENKIKKEYTIYDLPGVGAATAEKLKEVGFDDLMKIAVSSPANLVEATGIGESVARRMIGFARDKLDMGFESGEELLKKREKITKITTGSKELNKLIGGGVETGAITEAYGAYGSGKTSIAHQLAVNVQLPKDKGGADGIAVWIDSENTLRPGYIQDIAKAAGLDPIKALRNFRGVRSLNSDHQMLLAEKISDLITKENLPIKLIIVDSLMSHFRADFCVLPDTLLIGNPSVKKIEDFGEGERVLTHKGVFRKILTKSKMTYNGSVLTIRPQYGMPITLTGDHAVLAVKTIRKSWYKRYSNFKRKADSYLRLIDHGSKHYGVYEGFGPDWIKADTLKKGDYLIYPIIKETNDVDTIKVSDYLESNYFITENNKIKANNFFHSIEDYNTVINEYKKNPVHGTIKSIAQKYSIPISTVYQWVVGVQQPRIDIIELNNEIPLTPEVMRLLGYYLAEGSGVSDHQIRFTFNSKEKEYIEDVKNLVAKYFGIKPNKDVITGKATNVCFSSRLLKEFFKNLFGSNAREKRLPNWMLHLSKEKQEELINGYWKGDGSKSRDGFNFSTASRLLAEQVRLILARLGFIPCFRVVTKNRKNPKYVVEVFGRDLMCFSEIVGERHKALDRRKGSRNNGWVDENYLYIPIKSIQKNEYDGDIYNIEVEEDHSYCTNYCTLHNCGRGMLAERQQKLNKHMHILLKLAQQYDIAVYVTNQVMAKPDTFFGDPTEAIGGHVLAHSSTYRLYLRRGKKGTRVAKLVDAPALPEGECIFQITGEGVKDVEGKI